MVIRRITDRMGDVVADRDDLVDELEDSVLSAQNRELRMRLSLVRRQAISLRRYISPQRDVLARLQHERIPGLSDAHRVHIREAAERTARFVEDLDAGHDRAAITQEELNNRLSEQMSRTMYILSLVAGIFLPLGLITGLLGINVGGIPGSEFKWAFIIVCVVLAVIAVIEYLLFKRKAALTGAVSVRPPPGSVSCPATPGRSGPSGRRSCAHGCPAAGRGSRSGSGRAPCGSPRDSPR